MLLPSSASDPATMVAQALSIYNSVSAKAPLLDGGCAAAEIYLKLTKPRMQGVVGCGIAAPHSPLYIPLPDLLWG
jgi:hypothetical protein